jgi:hypothetical protein
LYRYGGEQRNVGLGVDIARALITQAEKSMAAGFEMQRHNQPRVETV